MIPEQISLTELSCNCPDWYLYRRKYESTDPRRLCKHLLNAVLENPLPESLERYAPILKIFQQRSRGFPLYEFEETKEIGSQNVTVFFPEKKKTWVDIFINGIDYRYNYKISQWIFKNEPQNRKRIESWISSRVAGWKGDRRPLPKGAKAHPR